MLPGENYVLDLQTAFYYKDFLFFYSPHICACDDMKLILILNMQDTKMLAANCAISITTQQTFVLSSNENLLIGLFPR